MKLVALIIVLLYYTLMVYLDEGEYIGQIVVNTTQPDGFIERFINKYPGFNYLRKECGKIFILNCLHNFLLFSKRSP